MSVLKVLVQPDVAAAVSMLLDRDGRSGPALDTEARIAAIGTGLARSEGVAMVAAPEADGHLNRRLDAVHEGRYLDFVAHHDKRDVAPPPLQHDFLAPGVDPDTPLGPGMFSVALSAAACAVAAASSLRCGELSYALCRPPGHHAGRSYLGGYCFLNNAALAAQTLLMDGHQRVAVIDLDFHFGNGTADILADSEQVLFASLHADTEHSFPYQATAPRGPHQHFYSFATSPSANAYLDRLASALEEVNRFAATALVVSIGFDIIDGDPHGGWTLSPSIFADIGSSLRGSRRPICLVQEGGYHLGKLADCAAELARGLTETR